MCNKAALLNNGKLLFFGDVEEAFKEYDQLSGTGA
jgi:ABC-type polysaccharide/polyol phosphate transport system ATPase subunit